MLSNVKRIEVESHFVSFLDFKNDSKFLKSSNLEKDVLKFLSQDGYDKIVFQILYQNKNKLSKDELIETHINEVQGKILFFNNKIFLSFPVQGVCEKKNINQNQ